jgi:signal peptidase I
MVGIKMWKKEAGHFPNLARILCRSVGRLSAAALVAWLAAPAMRADVRQTAPVIMRVAYTGSMWPMFRGGELVRVTKGEFTALKIGDVVIVWHEGKKLNVIHRIIDRRATAHGLGYVTKGIANWDRDRVILTADNFVGTATKL